MESPTIKLGQLVKDRVSGFEGIAVWRSAYLQGCDRYGVQPPINEKGDLPKAHEFDEPDLEVVGDGLLKPVTPEPVQPEPVAPPRRRRTGGPHDHEPQDRRTH